MARIVAPGVFLIEICLALSCTPWSVLGEVEGASAMAILRRATQLVPSSGRMAEIFDVAVPGRSTWMYPAGTTRMVAHGHACMSRSSTHQAPNVRGPERGMIPPPILAPIPPGGHAIHFSPCLCSALLHYNARGTSTRRRSRLYKCMMVADRTGNWYPFANPAPE